AKLTAMGFRLLEPKQVPGQKDWVNAIDCRGRRVGAGDRISIDTPLRLVIGSGTYDEDDEDISYTEPEIDTGELSETDDFEEVSEPPVDMGE
ncbi:MAG: penicillin-binding protein, partial [Prevotella sp.]|nr:penicillin-binding protein [Prevotella sp.]